MQQINFRKKIILHLTKIPTTYWYGKVDGVLPGSNTNDGSGSSDGRVDGPIDGTVYGLLLTDGALLGSIDGSSDGCVDELTNGTLDGISLIASTQRSVWWTS